MKALLDTSALIYLNDFRKFKKIFTVTEVLDEIKDRNTLLKLSGLKIEVLEPKKETVNEIKNIARKTGDLEKLSKTDLKILALAKETGSTIISDDYCIQNVAQKIGINYISLFSKKITKLIKWKKFCPICRRYFGNGKICPFCGEKLIRLPTKIKKIRNL